MGEFRGSKVYCMSSEKHWTRVGRTVLAKTTVYLMQFKKLLNEVT